MSTLVFMAASSAATACSKNKADVPAAANAAAADSKAAGAKKADDTTPPPGVDLTKLDEFERKVFFRVLGQESSACGKAHSLMVSVKTDKGCRKSLYAARYVARLVDGGYTDSEISESVQKRFRGGRQNVNIVDAPVKGNPAAPVTIVEFVDYECPHCKRVQPVLRSVLDEYKDEVKVVFKHYPLSAHANARLAAEGAVAAHKQGKFWAFNDKVWAISESLTPAGLEQIAKEVGLDVAKWRTDMESAEVQARVDRDRSEGQGLGIDHTPTIYVNGREFTDPREVDALKDWVNEELNR
ncbi:MAG TPA: thioredoxin domain-containing protein [Polyangia bacterium]